jgi:POT family proton-dependent oligopeptide transporter
MRVGHRSDEGPASVLQAVNAIYILVLGLAFTALWSFFGTRGFEPSTPIKFALGLLQLGLGFVAFWYGAVTADDRGMVSMSWLLLGYLLHTTGELCISPVGLSMVTKLSPRDLVSTVMGTWFLATAFSQFLAAMIAQFTRVESGEGKIGAIPPPLETVGIYGDVFGRIAIAAVISAAIFLALAPILKVWMHEGAPTEADGD